MQNSPNTSHGIDMVLCLERYERLSSFNSGRILVTSREIEDGKGDSLVRSAGDILSMSQFRNIATVSYRDRTDNNATREVEIDLAGELVKADSHEFVIVSYLDGRRTRCKLDPPIDDE